MINNTKNKKIAVVANMSAGKSTFLNALFGDSILPAYSHATTDCPIYIYSDDNPDNDKAIIEFSDSKKTIELEKEEVKKELKYYAQKDSDILDEKYKNVKKIDLYWDFLVLQNSEKQNNNFVLIDTPGPNNTDEYASKHSDSTKDIVLNEADMLLYLFDYGQIDANLLATQNNLWSIIKEKKEKDPNFEVFFVINKIDKALQDNKKIIEIKDSKSKEEYYKNIVKHWMHYEKIAIEKIRNSAKRYGFKNPRVFTISSLYIEYNRNKKSLTFDQLDELDEFIKFFKNSFGEKWNSKFHQYLSHRKIESALKKLLMAQDSKFLKRKKTRYKKR